MLASSSSFRRLLCLDRRRRWELENALSASGEEPDTTHVSPSNDPSSAPTFLRFPSNAFIVCSLTEVVDRCRDGAVGVEYGELSTSLVRKDVVGSIEEPSETFL